MGCFTVLDLSKGPSINYVVSGRGGGQKLPILLSKKTTKRGRGSKIADFRTTKLMEGSLATILQ